MLRAADPGFGPRVIAGTRPGPIRLPRPLIACDMVLASLEEQPLTATAALAWNGDLPRPLQQVLSDAADSITSPGPAPYAGPEPAAVGS